VYILFGCEQVKNKSYYFMAKATYTCRWHIKTKSMGGYQSSTSSYIIPSHALKKRGAETLRDERTRSEW